MGGKQAIKYQSTGIPVEKTISELSALIRKYGGSRFEQAWNSDGTVSGVRFAIRHEQFGALPVNLTARSTKIRSILFSAGLWKSYRSAEREQMIQRQAERIAWRHIKDLTEQLLLAVQLDLRSLPEAFMADVEILDAGSGETMRVAEFLERRARTVSRGEGLVLEASHQSENSAIPLPSAHSE